MTLAQNKWQSLRWIIFAALLVRLVAAIFAQGYGMHDDHFLIIEASGSWVDRYDYNHWLPWSEGNTGKPEGHSFTYVGLNFLLFKFLKLIGIADPKLLMLFNRLVHALFSLLTVYLSYKITEKLSNKENAAKIGWLMALLWALPFLSVRNLVEVTAIPWVLLSVWLQIRKAPSTQIIWAGMAMGMAISFRYQIGVYALTVAAIFFFRKEWKAWFYYCLGVVFVFCLTQGLVDYMIWGYPFAEFWGYVTYNMNEGTAYLPNKNYFMYFLVLMGTMLLPLGVLLMIGFFKSAKKYFVVFLPVLVFILFHTLYPNRQERFIFSILPLFVILGFLGYQLFVKPAFQKWWKVSWVIFWSINIPVMIILCFVYTKKSRVEAMYALYNDGISKEHVLLEGSASQNVSMMPVFYSQDWHYNFSERTDAAAPLQANPEERLDYIFFFDDKDLAKRIQQYKTLYPKMTLFKKCEPSFMDKLVRAINPRNKNEYIEIWKTNAAH
jgi:hypothetical protein